MNDKQPTITPTFSKTHQHFYPPIHIEPEQLLRGKASSSRYSAYTTSKKKLSEIHSDLHELEVKFNHFHQNLNHFMNCDNRSSELQSIPRNRVSAEIQMRLNQSANQQLLDLTYLENGVIFETSKAQELSFLPQTQPQPFVLTTSDHSRVLNFPKIDQAHSIKKVSQQQKQFLLQKNQLKQQKQSQNKQKQKSSSNPQKLKKSKINKSYAVRNFPMEYFTNVELLFEIMNRKKHRIKHKQTHSEGKSKKHKQRKTLDQKENLHQQPSHSRLLTQQHQFTAEGVLDESKPTCVQFKQEVNFSVFETDRKLSKDTVVRKNSTSKILTKKNKIQPNVKTFIPIQKNFLNKNTTTNPKDNQAKTQRDFYNKPAETQDFNSPNIIRSRRMLSPKQQIPENSTIGVNNFDEGNSKNKVNFWSPQNRQLVNASKKKINCHYVNRIQETKTADENFRRKNPTQKQKIEDSLILVPPAFRNTEILQPVKIYESKNQQKEIKTSDLDQTGIFSGDQFNFITKNNKASPSKLLQYKEEDSFLKKINQNHPRKSRYCQCCFGGKQDNLNGDESKSKSRSRNHQSKCQKKMNERSQGKLETENENSKQKSSTYQRLVKKSQEKGKSVTQRNFREKRQEKDQSEKKIFDKAFKSHKLHKAKSSVNVLGVALSKRQAPEKLQKIEKESEVNQRQKSDRNRSKKSNVNQVNNKTKEDIALKDPTETSIKQIEKGQQQANSNANKECFVGKVGFGIQNSDKLMSQQQSVEKQTEILSEKTEIQEVKQKSINQAKDLAIRSQIMPNNIIQSKNDHQEEREQFLDVKQQIVDQNKISSDEDKKDNPISEQVPINQPAKNNILDELTKNEDQQKRKISCRSTFNPNAFMTSESQKEKKEINTIKLSHSLTENQQKENQNEKGKTQQLEENQIYQSQQQKQQEIICSKPQVEQVEDEFIHIQKEKNCSVNSQEENIISEVKKINSSKLNGVKEVAEQNQENVLSSDQIIQKSEQNQAKEVDSKYVDNKNDSINVDLSGLSLAESYLTELYRNIDLLEHDIQPSDSYPSLLKSSHKSFFNLNNQRKQPQINSRTDIIAEKQLSSSQFMNESRIVLTNQQQNILQKREQKQTNPPNQQEEANPHKQQEETNQQNEQPHEQPSIYILKDEQTLKFDDHFQNLNNQDKEQKPYKGQNNEADNFLEEILQLQDMTKTRKWFETQSSEQQHIIQTVSSQQKKQEIASIRNQQPNKDQKEDNILKDKIVTSYDDKKIDSVNKNQTQECVEMKQNILNKQVSANNFLAENRSHQNQNQKVSVKCTSIQNLTYEVQDNDLAVRKQVKFDPSYHEDGQNKQISQANKARRSLTVNKLQKISPSLKVLQPFYSQMFQNQQSTNNLAPSYQQSLIQIAISSNDSIIKDDFLPITKPLLNDEKDIIDRVDEESGNFQMDERKIENKEISQVIEFETHQEKDYNGNKVIEGQVENVEMQFGQLDEQSQQIYQVGDKVNNNREDLNQNLLVDEYLSSLYCNIINHSTLHQVKNLNQKQQNHSIPLQVSEQKTIQTEYQPAHIREIISSEVTHPSITPSEMQPLSLQQHLDYQQQCLPSLKDITNMIKIQSNNQLCHLQTVSKKANQVKPDVKSNKTILNVQIQKEELINGEIKKTIAAIDSKVVSICVMEPYIEQQTAQLSAIPFTECQSIQQTIPHQVNQPEQIPVQQTNLNQQSSLKINQQPSQQRAVNQIPLENITLQSSFNSIAQSQSNKPFFNTKQAHQIVASTQQAFTQVEDEPISHSSTFRQKFYKSHQKSLSSCNQNFINTRNQIFSNYQNTQNSFVNSKNKAAAKNRQLEQENSQSEQHQVHTRNNSEETVRQFQIKQSSKQNQPQKNTQKIHNSQQQKPSYQPESCSHNNLKSTHTNKTHQHKVQCQQCARIQHQSHFHYPHPHINPYMTPYMSPFMNPYMTSMDFYHHPFQKMKSKKRFYRSRESSEEEESSYGQDQNYHQEKKRKKTSRKMSQNLKTNNHKNSKKKNEHAFSEEQSENSHFSSEYESEVEQKPKHKNASSKNKKQKAQQENSILTQSELQLSDSSQQISRLKRDKSPQKKLVKKAEIVNYITNQQAKSILTFKMMKLDSIKHKFDQQLKLAMRLLNFIDPQHNLMKRLIQTQVDSQKPKLWLFPNQLEFKPQSSFQPISIKLPSQNIISNNIKPKQISEFISVAVHKLLQQFPYEQSNMVKEILQIITGSTLFNIKSSSFNKLKNLHKHQNIKGFTFSSFKHQLYQIVSSEEIQQKDGAQTQKEASKIVVLRKCSLLNQRKQHVEDILMLMDEKISRDEEVINVKWEDFLKKFTHSLIGVFGVQYQVRALHFVNQRSQIQQSTKKNFVFTMQLKGSVSLNDKKQKKQKQHCLINVNLFGNKSSQTQQQSESLSRNKGRILVYQQVQQSSNQFKYIGSGDLTFISMRVKEGKYLVVLQFGKRTLQNMQEGKVIINYGGKTVGLSESKWTNDYASMMAGEETEFIKANRV